MSPAPAFDSRLLRIVVFADGLLIFILFGLIGYVRPANPGPLGWILLTVIYVLLSINIAALLRFAALEFGGGPPGGGRRSGGYVILFLLATAFGIIVAFTALYAGFATDYDNLKGLYAAVGALATVQTPPQRPTTAGVIGVTQELIDLVFISGIVTVALGRTFNRP